ncbi:N-acetyltransferase [Mycolicibacterium sp. P1-18]|uniref:GNAT family N-acetyltransferase n=1 Tax=Mycolicibacterium sp. P1-18 TaxID=2024615 RepID=UPI0011F0C847|nr:GNAT family N-acetyltransferase [Mycolicibacterium sp. P1-18]KAA0101846.1 N-acetyltransferase [Mycolicibacterium sp. P1-18]
MTTLGALRIDAGDVVLRKARDGDRRSIIDHLVDPDVHAHLGGPQPRPVVTRDLDEAGVAAATDSAGSYVIADKDTDTFIGTVSLTRRGLHHPGHLGPSGEELELAYTLERRFWGRGLAFQAASALLRIAAAELRDEPVIVVTQSANIRSLNLARRLGFHPAMTFEEFGEEQTLAVANLGRFRET